MQRRTFLQGAVGAPLGEAISPSDRWLKTTVEEENSEEMVRLVGEADTADFRTIQAAHNDLPTGETNRRGGSGLIVVDGTYDSDQEEFPIHIHKYVDVRGRTPTRCRVWADDTENVFYIENPNDATFFERVSISNLYIRGGLNGIVLDGVSWFNGDRLIVRDTARDGITAVRDRSEAGLFNGYLSNCLAWNCGRHGYYLPSETAPHGYLFVGSVANRCGGVGAYLGGYAVNVVGGAYEQNHSYGLELERAGAMGIHNAYIEFNGRGMEHPRDVRLGDNARGAKLHNCYLHGGKLRDDAQSHAAIVSGNNSHCEVDHCTFRGYDRIENSGLFDISDVSDNIELNLGSHQRIGDEMPTFLRRPESFYSRGILYSADIDGKMGRYAGERAFVDGRFYLWNDVTNRWDALVTNPATTTLNMQGNDITNVGTLRAATIEDTILILGENVWYTEMNEGWTRETIKGLTIDRGETQATPDENRAEAVVSAANGTGRASFRANVGRRFHTVGDDPREARIGTVGSVRGLLDAPEGSSALCVVRLRLIDHTESERTSTMLFRDGVEGTETTFKQDLLGGMDVTLHPDRRYTVFVRVEAIIEIDQDGATPESNLLDSDWEITVDNIRIRF